MIAINDDFRALLLKKYWECYENTQDSVSVLLFDGTMPTDQELETFLASSTYDAAGWLNGQSFLAQLTGAGYTELLNIHYPNFVERRLTSPRQMDFLFAQRSETAFGKADDKEATWFWLFQHQDSYPDRNIYWNTMGTVGGIESGADMELSETVISTSRSYKMNDVVLNFDIKTQNQSEVPAT